MSFPLTRSATAVALALSVGLVTLPACKKAKPTVPDSPAQAPMPVPGPNLPVPGSGAADSFPPPPQAPIFHGQSPLLATIRAGAEANMRQIGLALHNFESAYGALPAGYADQTGKPGLSWRVAILPFIEQDGLFKQFKLDEPWNSEHNKALIAKMPKMFAPPDKSTNGYTFARGFTGPNTWLPPQAQLGRPGQPLLGIKLIQITDGTANTFLVADAGDAVIWTKPDEMPFAPNNVPKLGGVFESGMVVGMADGTSKFIRKGADPKMIANAIQINDGNVVKLDD